MECLQRIHVVLGPLEARGAVPLQAPDEGGGITVSVDNAREISEAIHEFQASFADACPPRSEGDCVPRFLELDSGLRFSLE